MKCKSKRFLTAILIGLFAIGFSSNTLSSIGSTCEEPFIFCGVGQVVDINKDVLTSNGFYQTANPLAYLFQFLFILFIISPPIMALFLYLIWKELKKRNELK